MLISPSFLIELKNSKHNTTYVFQVMVRNIPIEIRLCLLTLAYCIARATVNVWRLILIIFLLIITSSTKAQPPLHHVEIIDEIKGLSSNEITSIAQDKNGFLWIATLHGLNRYDGADINPDSAVEKKDLFLVNKSNCVAVEKNSL